ncbi:hypothetical protein PINS_up008569 [Pythium insidiosum]|nr:hypothetical protein PINS_up008569 [Pythium insidiosum]
MSSAFKVHLRLLMDFVRDTPDVDADLFLDPFFFWPPPIGVVIATANPGESVADCVARLDCTEPFRIYFVGSPAADSHPVMAHHQRVLSKFVPRYPSSVGPPLDSPDHTPTSSPPGSPTSVVLDAISARRQRGPSPDADPAAEAVAESIAPAARRASSTRATRRASSLSVPPPPPAPAS